MDGKGNNRGAYAQVTAPIGDDPKVTIQQGGKSGGMCSSCTPKRLGIAIAAAILLIILIIVIVVISTKNNNGPKAVKGNTTATEASRVSPEMVTTKHLNPSMSSMTTGVTTPTQPPTMKATTTFGPAVLEISMGPSSWTKPMALTLTMAEPRRQLPSRKFHRSDG
ncbi:uncharacterized protein LOC752155 isoform X3 [Strongylocentrotus purpuratus]|uniref:Uncharacterized protein n=1 Tax=Strongylocentrotus purpuratus TaxID=7668 RepID=A0A7M7N3R2_STRPU|nr:uncharacterized protein LOC752155 isoform X3 [Strongylocentrotus purpuratus]